MALLTGDAGGAGGKKAELPSPHGAGSSFKKLTIMKNYFCFFYAAAVDGVATDEEDSEQLDKAAAEDELINREYNPRI